MEVEKGVRRFGIDREFAVDALHIFALFAFAVAQPLYDLLGQNAEFFVAHRSDLKEILAFIGLLSLGAPLVLVLLEFLALQVSAVVQKGLHVFFVLGLSVAFVTPLLKKVHGLHLGIFAAAALLIGAGVAFAYARHRAVRVFVTVLSPGVVAFPLIFLFASPVFELIRPVEKPVIGKVAVGNPVPIVLVVFDEFEASSLLDAHRKIDPVRFPNFAAFAQESTWYSKAVAAWTETKRAVPAILTGETPHLRSVTPSLESYPNNLFTWLGSSYRLNVHETLTSLCPEELCRPAETADDDVLSPALLSDVVVIYLHVILPRALESRFLPPLDTGWKGFAGTATAPADDDHQGAPGRQLGDRAGQFSAFIDSIRKEDQRALHFLHILLPHVKYSYLPSGSDYFGEQTEGLLDKGLGDPVWTDDGILPAHAYHRFLLQAGFVDTLLGRLVHRLKAENLFEKALIVIASDHGKSFRPGQPKRIITEINYPDLLHVPLFVKYPGQHEGARVERVVSNLDIVPTIADVIRAEVPWKVDGQPLNDPSAGERTVIEMNELDGRPARRFDAAEVTNDPRLEWKLNTFGSGTNLSRTAVANPFSGLIGRDLSSLPIDDKTGQLVAQSDQFEQFLTVDKASGVIPANFRGTIEAEDARDGPMQLAIAVNGRIEAVTQTTRWLDHPQFFTVMLPEDGFRSGKNQVEVFAIEKAGEQVRLSRVSVPVPQEWRLAEDQDGREVLVSGEDTYAIDKETVRGHLDEVSASTLSVGLQGWAMDATKVRPASRIVVFAGGRYLVSGEPKESRQDVVKAYNAADLLVSGYHFSVSASGVKGNSPLRVFGITADGKASELTIGPKARAGLGRLD